MSIIISDRVGPRLLEMDRCVQTVFQGPPSALFENQCKHDGLYKIEKQNSRCFKLSMPSTTGVFIPGGGEHARKISYRD